MVFEAGILNVCHLRCAEWVEPLLERYSVQLYLAGHDHDVEHIHSRGQKTHHIVSGGGSQTRPVAGGTDSLFQHSLQGVFSIFQRFNLVVETNAVTVNSGEGREPPCLAGAASSLFRLGLQGGWQVLLCAIFSIASSPHWDISCVACGIDGCQPHHAWSCVCLQS